ncbi:aromatase/cyclase [Actinocorallia lasiicapitis]
MRSIRLHALVPTQDTMLVFEKITAFSDYPKAADDVRTVTIEPDGVHSVWEVNFRRGIMRWTERDDIRRDDLTVTFSQTAGDFARFEGSWKLTPGADGCEVELLLAYDFGIESLAGLMDPLAERVIKRAICFVLADAVGTVEVLAGGEALTDLGELPAGSGIRIRDAS